MHVILFAYQTWGHRVLQALLDSHHEPVLLVTHPQGDDAYETLWTDDVAQLAEAHGVPVLAKQVPDAETEQAVRDAGADVMVACNWRTWIPDSIFSAPRLGTLNVHDSLLPKYAGFAPINWAIINGEREVGVTAHVMDAGLDQGPIIEQWRVPVGATDTSADLFARTLELFGPITIQGLEHLEHGTGDRRAQDLEQGSFFHKRADEDNRIDWTWPARDISNLVRAQADPYPNAWCHHGDARLEICEASVSPRRAGGTPGRVFARQGNGVIIVCGPDARRGRQHGLVLERVRTEDGAVSSAGDYFERMGGYLTSHAAPAATATAR